MQTFPLRCIDSIFKFALAFFMEETLGRLAQVARVLA